MTLPFLGRLSLQIRKKLRLIANSHLPHCKLRVVFKIRNRLRNNFRFKDIIPNELKSNVLYKYTCSSCNARYEGETSRHSYVRFCEHLGITPYLGKPSTRKVINSPIYEHIMKSGHNGTLENFEITGGGSNFTNFQLQVMESLLIKKNSPILNGNQTSVPLKLFWHYYLSFQLLTLLHICLFRNKHLLWTWIAVQFETSVVDKYNDTR